MIRKATLDDIEQIEETYNEHFNHELKYGAFTVFKKGIYPTVKDAESAISAGTLYVYTKNTNIAGSIILDKLQPAEYTEISWQHAFTNDEVMVIHLLLIRPSMAGKGIATSLMEYAVKLATDNSCKALRLDTGNQNTPAISLYKKMGFQIASIGSMMVGSTIEHSNHLFLEKIL